MATFTRQLPALLAQTHVVLEVRDVRLPLTSINPTLEAALQKWKKGREAAGGGVCERIVVYSKRDLISGGEEVRSLSLSLGALLILHLSGVTKCPIKTF